MSVRWILLIAGAMGLLSGCGGSGGGLDANGRPIGEGGGGGPLVATWRSIQDNIFTPRCTECHAGGAAPLGLRLDEAVSYEQLVGVRSVQIPQLFRVDPGDPDASYLVQKVEGAAGILGGRMPLERAALSAQQIAVIRQWIADGAPRGDAPLPLRVTALTPSPGSVVGALTSAVTATFNQGVSSATVTATTVMLVRAGGDGGFTEGNEVAVLGARILTPDAQTITLDLADLPPLVEDDYQVVLRGTGTALRDADGNALDGEFTGEFPSGDGTAGGDFVAGFTVAEARLQVTALSPAPGATVTGDLAEITATLSRPVDGTTVGAASVTLTGSGGDDVFGNGNDVAVGPISAQATGASTIAVDLGGAVPLADDTYRLRLSGTVSPITDALGNALDGEFPGTFPSGNGVAGGDFAADFIVRNPVVDLLNVTALSPAPGTTVTGDLAAVIATFDRAVDAATVTAGTFLLTGSGGDGTFDDGDEIPVAAASVSATGASEATFDLSGVGPLANDTYEVRLVGDGAAPMRDTDDRALDGEFAGSFPSGDGEAGGDLVATFTVFTPPTTFVVTAMDPEPDSILGVLPRTLTLTLSRDIDAATLADAVDLIASGGDGTFGNGNDLRLTPGLATVALSGADTIAITLNAFFPSLADTFRVTVRDTLEDTGAEALDGEFAGTLPSGDGTEGGDFDVEFEVRVLPKLTSIQANVFDVTCTQCHFGDPEFAPQGLSLDEEHAYDLLVGIASTEKPEYQRVESGNPDDSYLIRKLEGGPDILGTRMPQFGEALEPEVIAAIRQWITDGASR